MENTVFNWNKFYSQKNANILEVLLDRKTAPFVEIMKIFFPNHVAKLDIDSYLVCLIQSNLIHGLINHMVSLNIPLCFFTEEYFYLWFGQMWGRYYIANIGEPEPEVYTETIFSLLIGSGALPTEIRRLPRLATKDISPTYYENILDYDSATDEDIISHEVNYCSEEPLTLTYFEAIKFITQHGCPDALLKNSNQEGTVSVCLEVPQEYVRNNRQLRQVSTNLAILREANCGNASYKKRYKGLERLKKEVVDNLFQGKTVSTKTVGIEHLNTKDRQGKDIKMQGMYGTYIAKSLEVQTTDIETKYHLKRRIIACVQRMQDSTTKISNEFELKDTRWLQEDLSVLILFYNQSTGDQIKNIPLTIEEIKSIKTQLEHNPKCTLRIKKQFDHYQAKVKDKFPKSEISNKKVVEMIHRLEKPIYDELRISQPSIDNYSRYSRQKKKSNQKTV